MATLYICEYEHLALAPEGSIAVGQETVLGVTEQTVAIGVSSAQSSTFNARTNFVRLHADAICSIKFGTNPTAAATNKRMAANQTEYFGVPQGASFKVAVIQNT